MRILPAQVPSATACWDIGKRVYAYVCYHYSLKLSLLHIPASLTLSHLHDCVKLSLFYMQRRNADAANLSLIEPVNIAGASTLYNTACWDIGKRVYGYVCYHYSVKLSLFYIYQHAPLQVISYSPLCEAIPFLHATPTPASCPLYNLRILPAQVLHLFIFIFKR